MISSIMIYGIWVYTNIRQMKRLNKMGEFIPPLCVLFDQINTSLNKSGELFSFQQVL